MLESVPTFYLAIGAILVGFAGLIWSADRFVGGAAAIASTMGIAPMIIGLTIVSLGTSAPEVMVSLIAALQGTGALAVGNAIGSNIANIGLVLGVTAIVAIVPVQRHILKDEAPVLIAITLLSGVFLWDASISFIEGVILMASLIPAMWYLVYCKQRDFSPAEVAEEESLPEMTLKLGIVWFIIGLVTLIVTSKILVWGAETIALHYEVSPFIIGLTVVAIGTSLPELAASVTSALKGHHDIAVGNIIGSNIFNLLAVMSIPGLVEQTQLQSEVLTRDYLTMLVLTLLLMGSIAFAIFKPKAGSVAHIGRYTGILLLVIYIGYIGVIGMSQTAA